jgi:hypothetical protein
MHIWERIGESIREMKMKKVLSLSSPPIPRDQLDRLIEAVCPEEGDARGLEWALNDDGSLDLYTEG